MFKGLIGRKIGMTQIFDENGAAIPVTLLEAGPCFVSQVKTPETDGYSAVQLAFGETKPRLTRAGGHLRNEQPSSGTGLREFRTKLNSLTTGSELKADVLVQVNTLM